MNLKTYSYSLLIFISVGINNSSAQKELPQTDCDLALKQYNTDIEKIIRSSTELMYSTSGLIGLKKNKPSGINNDSYAAFENFDKLDTARAWSVMERILHYNNDVESVLSLQSYAIDGVLNTYITDTKDKDCL